MDPNAAFRSRQVQSNSTLNRKEYIRKQAGKHRPDCSFPSIGRAASGSSPVQTAQRASEYTLFRIHQSLEHQSQPARRTDPRNQEAEVTRRSFSQTRARSPDFSGGFWCSGSLLSDGRPRWFDQRWLSPSRRPLIMLLELIVATEASVLSASWFRRSRMRRQQILLGGSPSEMN